MNIVEKTIKRAFDILGAGIGLLLSSPLFVIVALLIKIDSSGPVFFKQDRAGLRGNPFVIYKFRTMKDVHDDNGTPLPDEQRITRLGMFLRKTSIDGESIDQLALPSASNRGKVLPSERTPG